MEADVRVAGFEDLQVAVRAREIEETEEFAGTGTSGKRFGKRESALLSQMKLMTRTRESSGAWRK